MKKTLLIITLFIGLGNLNAQDASNDATWEETISFIKKYSNYINTNFSAYGVSYCDDLDFELTNSQLKSYSKTSEYGSRETLYTRECVYSIDLLKLKSINIGEDYVILYTTGNNCIARSCQYWKDKDGSGKDCMHSKIADNLHLGIDDKEMCKRISKAFEHLAYLATEKRETERKASGDKF